MTITDLCVYKDDTWRLELDGRSDTTFFINESTVQAFSLGKGQELSGEALAQVRGADLLRKAKRRALHLLGVREFCYSELLNKLLRSYPEETARAAADYAAELGYIDDEAYAPKLAEYLIHTKRFGLRKAKYEMLHRGLDAQLVENVLDRYGEDEIDEEITVLLSRRYSEKIQDPDDRRRTIAALVRRGYDFRAVKRCIEALLDEEYDDDEDFE